HATVPPGGEPVLASVRESNAVDGRRVVHERRQQLAGRRLPGDRELRRGQPGDDSVVVREYQSGDLRDQNARGRIVDIQELAIGAPALDAVIRPDGGDGLAVGREGDAHTLALAAEESLQALAGFHLP